MAKHREGKTGLSEGQANLLIGNLGNILAQLPLIKKRAPDHIIGRRRIKQEEKTLSVYEPGIKVILPGQAGSEIEFGNQLMIGEHRDGLITCYELFDDVKNHWSRLPGARQKTEHNIGAELKLILGHRGFSHAKTESLTENTHPGLTNHICPQSTELHNEKRKHPEFRESQKRRAQTEARIAILVHNDQQGRS